MAGFLQPRLRWPLRHRWQTSPSETSGRRSLWQIVHSEQLRRIDNAVFTKGIAKQEVNLEGIPLEVTPLWNGAQIVGTLVVVCDQLSPTSEGLIGATVYMVTLRNQSRRRDPLAIFTSKATAQGYAATYNHFNPHRHLAIVEPYIAIVQDGIETGDFTVD